MEGVFPGDLLTVLREEYGRKLIVRSAWGDRMLDVLMAPFYQRQPKELSPGDYLRLFRTDRDINQAELGRCLGGIPRQNVSSMEKGTRPINRTMAIRLSIFFGVSPDKFIG